MRILRIAAGIVFVLWALLAVGAAGMLTWWIDVLPPRIQAYASRVDVWSGFLPLAGLSLWSAWQVLWGQGRWLAWVQACATVLAAWRFGWLVLLVVAIPLVYLVLELVISTRRPKTNKTKAKPVQDVLEGALGIGVLVGCLWVVGQLPGLTPPDDMEDGWLMWAAYCWVSILLHEAGHALAGRAVGFELHEFFVAPFVYTHQSGRHRVGFRPGLGGHYIGFPADRSTMDWRGHWITVAAGPVANFVTFLLLWPALATMGAGLGPVAYGFWYGLMKWSLVGTVFNLIPLKMGGFRTDGRYLWEGYFRPEEGRLNLAMASAMASRGSALRPRDWPAAWPEAMLLRMKQDPGAAGLMALWVQDRLLTEPVEAATWDALADCVAALEHHAGELDDARAKAFRFHAAWMRCRYDGLTQGVAEALAPGNRDKKTEPWELLRLQAALAACEGATPRAVELLEQAERDLAKRPASGFNLTELEDLRAFRASLASNGLEPVLGDETIVEFGAETGCVAESVAAVL